MPDKEVFEGFEQEPSTWDFPMVINGWAHKLSGAAFKVLWYILRHTYGWQKDSDTISYIQFQYGIRRKDGTWLDRGTGLRSKTSISKALSELLGFGFIEIEKRRNESGRQAVTLYKPKFRKGGPESKKWNLDKPGSTYQTPQSGLGLPHTPSLEASQQSVNNNNGRAGARVRSAEDLVSYFSRLAGLTGRPGRRQIRKAERLIQEHTLEGATFIVEHAVQELERSRTRPRVFGIVESFEGAAAEIFLKRKSEAREREKRQAEEREKRQAEAENEREYERKVLRLKSLPPQDQTLLKNKALERIQTENPGSYQKSLLRNESYVEFMMVELMEKSPATTPGIDSPQCERTLQKTENSKHGG